MRDMAIAGTWQNRGRKDQQYRRTRFIVAVVAVVVIVVVVVVVAVVVVVVVVVWVTLFVRALAWILRRHFNYAICSNMFHRKEINSRISEHMLYITSISYTPMFRRCAVGTK